MGATALLYVILPRVALALLATIGLLRATSSVVPPDSLLPYARSAIDGDTLALPAERVRLTPYAYRPGPGALDGARHLLQAAWGASTHIELREPVAYGSEQEYVPRDALGAVDVEALVFNLAATPEAENHGAVLTRASEVRDADAQRMLVLVDETAFLDTMQGDSSLSGRIEERRETWRAFVRRYGLEPCLVNLSALVQGSQPDDDLVRRVRSASRQGAMR
jgi:hypothetical protein